MTAALSMSQILMEPIVGEKKKNKQTSEDVHLELTVPFQWLKPGFGSSFEHPYAGIGQTSLVVANLKSSHT
jgi:hypothetical protein